MKLLIIHFEKGNILYEQNKARGVVILFLRKFLRFFVTLRCFYLTFYICRACVIILVVLVVLLLCPRLPLAPWVGRKFPLTVQTGLIWKCKCLCQVFFLGRIKMKQYCLGETSGTGHHPFWRSLRNTTCFRNYFFPVDRTKSTRPLYWERMFYLLWYRPKLDEELSHYQLVSCHVGFAPVYRILAGVETWRSCQSHFNVNNSFILAKWADLSYKKKTSCSCQNISTKYWAPFKAMK